MIDKDENNDKAYYRRGMAYIAIGELNKAKSDLMTAYDLTDGKDQGIIAGLKKLKERQE